MGLILDGYYDCVEKYKEYMSSNVYSGLIAKRDSKIELIKPEQEDIEKYFVRGLEDLSLAVFNLLYSGRGYYIVNYRNEFGINRKAAGFKTKQDLIHYATWVVEDFLGSKKDNIEYLEKLKEKSVGKSQEEMLKDFLIENEFTDQLKELTYNMQGPEDMLKRLSLIEFLKEHKTIGYHFFSSIRFYKIIDDIYTALENIPNVDTYNIAPEPIEQTERESRMV